MRGRKQWNKQAATLSFLDKKPPKSLIQQGLGGSTVVGKDEVGSSNLPSSSSKKPCSFNDYRVFLLSFRDGFPFERSSPMLPVVAAYGREVYSRPLQIGTGGDIN